MENYIDLSNGGLVFDGHTLKLGMDFDHIYNLFSKHIKSKSNYRNKDGYNCMIVCFYDYPIYNLPAEVRIFFHNNISYKLYLSYDSNEIDINSTKKEMELYKEKVQHTAEILKENVSKQYEVGDNKTFTIKQNGFVFSSRINKECTECSATLEREDYDTN